VLARHICVVSLFVVLLRVASSRRSSHRQAEVLKGRSKSKHKGESDTPAHGTHARRRRWTGKGHEGRAVAGCMRKTPRRWLQKKLPPRQPRRQRRDETPQPPALRAQGGVPLPASLPPASLHPLPCSSLVVACFARLCLLRLLRLSCRWPVLAHAAQQAKQPRRKPTATAPHPRRFADYAKQKSATVLGR
jgi:hypothetical protein